MTFLFYSLIAAGTLFTSYRLYRGKSSLSSLMHQAGHEGPLLPGFYVLITIMLLPDAAGGIALFLGAILAHWFGTRAVIGRLPIHKGRLGTWWSRGVGAILLVVLVVMHPVEPSYLLYLIGTGLGLLLWPPAKPERA